MAKRLQEFPRLAYLVAGFLAYPASVNAALIDGFANRENVSSDEGEEEGTNVGATRDPLEPRHGGKIGGASVWLSWTAPASGIVRFTAEGSDFDTLLSAYILEPEPAQAHPFTRLREVGRGDDEEGRKESVIQFGAIEGTTYEIAVDGFNGAQGDIELEWELEETIGPPPTILSIPSDRSLVPGETLVMTVGVDPEGRSDDEDEIEYRWFLNGEAIEDQESPTLTIPDFQPEWVGHYRLRLEVDGARWFSAPIEVQINTEGLGSAIARDRLPDAYESGVVGVAPAAQLAPLRRLSIEPRQGPIGLARGFNGSQIFNTIYARSESDEPAHCSTVGAASYWLTYSPPADGVLELDTAGSEFPTALALYAFTPPLSDLSSLNQLGCDDSGAPSRIAISVSQGQNYAIAIDGVGGAKGLGRLNYQLTESPPEDIAPYIITDPLSQLVALGGPFTLRVEAEGTAPLTVQWYKDGAPMDGETSFTLFKEFADIADSGIYVAKISNTVGQIQSNPTQVDVLDPPFAGFETSETRLARGATETLQPTISGSQPFTFSWRKDGRLIDGETSATLELPNLDTDDSGLYTIEVRNPVGAFESQPLRIVVENAPPTPPSIEGHPVSQVIATGDTLQLSVNAAGSPPLSAQWYKDGQLILGESQFSLTRTSIQLEDSGAYSVIVSNLFGQVVSDTANVQVLNPPTAVFNTNRIVATEGETMTLTPDVSGSEPLELQWLKNDLPIEGETSTALILQSLALSDAGRYQIRARNQLADTQSSTVELCVVSAPTIRLDLRNASVHLTWRISSDVTAIIERTDNLESGQWSTIFNRVVRPPVLDLIDVFSGSPQSFYRFRFQ